MVLLVLGVAFFIVLHILSGVRRPRLQFREPLVAYLGERSYKALFSLLVLASIVLMVVGWREAGPVPLYRSPESLIAVGVVLAFLGIVTHLCSLYPSRLRRLARHPQFVGTILWAVGHLAISGDARALVLFGGIGLWALSMLRFGREHIRLSEPVAMSLDLLGAAVAILVAVGVAWLHALIAGGLLSF